MPVAAPEAATPVDHSMPALTGLRGLCALWVLVYHAWVYAVPTEIVFHLFGQPFRFHVFLSLGWSGVQILFVLSAFLLTTPFARANAGLARRPARLRYLARRIARVFPAFHVQLLILLGIGWLVTQTLIIDLAELPSYILMLFIPPPIGIGSPAAINGVWWTLPIELSFYLLLPLIAGLASWRWKWLLLCLCLASTALWRYYTVGILMPLDNRVFASQLPGSMDSFGVGMLGAVLHVHFLQQNNSLRQYRKMLLALLAITPLIFFGLGHWMAESYESYWDVSPIFFLWSPVFNLAVLVVILNLAANQSVICRLLAHPVIFYLGTISYGVYLWHEPLGHWLQQLPWIAGMEGYKFPRLALTMFIGSVMAATVSWFFVEKKSIALVRRIV